MTVGTKRCTQTSSICGGPHACAVMPWGGDSYFMLGVGGCNYDASTMSQICKVNQAPGDISGLLEVIEMKGLSKLNIYYAESVTQRSRWLVWMNEPLPSDAKQMSKRGRCVAYTSDYGAEYKVKYVDYHTCGLWNAMVFSMQLAPSTLSRHLLHTERKE